MFLHEVDLAWSIPPTVADIPAHCCRHAPTVADMLPLSRKTWILCAFKELLYSSRLKTSFLQPF